MNERRGLRKAADADKTPPPARLEDGIPQLRLIEGRDRPLLFWGAVLLYGLFLCYLLALALRTGF